MKLEKEVLWGRNLDEYKRMFALSKQDLTLTMLGCADGVASFNAEVSAQGGSVVSIDPLYQFEETEIQQRILNTFSEILAQVEQRQQQYDWTLFKSLEHLSDIREEAMSLFLNDYAQGIEDKRYIATQLPLLPFESQTFQLCLSSHFLFVSPHHLSVDFHIEAITELLRVAQEIRIFPVVDHRLENNGSLIDEVTTHFSRKGFDVSLHESHYFWQPSLNQRLCIKPKIK